MVVHVAIMLVSVGQNSVITTAISLLHHVTTPYVYKAGAVPTCSQVNLICPLHIY